MLYDIHNHNNYDCNGITSIVNIDSKDELIGTNKYFSCGIHPWKANLITLKEEISKIVNLASYTNCVALGEAGIDKLKGPAFTIQIEVFEAIAKLAYELNLPLIIHVVKAYDEVIFLHKKIQPKADKPWIIHGFRKDLKLANQLTRMGFKLSFGESLLFQQNLMQSFKETALQNLFFESDEHDSSIIQKLYDKAAQLKNISSVEMADAIRVNVMNVFSIN